MLHPTIEELTQGKFNRYELALATAKCARIITNKYVSQRDKAEKEIATNKDNDKPLNAMIDRELRDEKAVKVAIGKIYDKEYSIVRNDTDGDDFVDTDSSVQDISSQVLSTPVVEGDDDIDKEKQLTYDYAGNDDETTEEDAY